MVTGYPDIVIPNEVSHMVRVFVDNEPPKDNPVPVYWDCFMVYFKATRMYYSGITCRYKDYLNAINSPGSTKYKALPKALLKQLSNSTDFQFIVTSRGMRNDVEGALRKIGVLRVATKMGECLTNPRTMYRVHNPTLNVCRYIVTDCDASVEDIIKATNTAFRYWLQSPSRRHYDLRITLRTATNSLSKTNSQVFGEGSIVTPVMGMTHIAVNKHRQMVVDANIRAAEQFLKYTTGAL